MRNLLIRILQALVLVAVAASFAHAEDFVLIKKKMAAAAGGGCMTGTYVMAWDGDYTADTDKSCIGSTPTDGTIQAGATVGTDYGETGNGVLVDAVNEAITWALADGDFVEANPYTLCVRMRVGSDGTDVNTIAFEIAEDSDSTNYVTMVADDTEHIRCSIEGNNVADVVASAGTFTRDGATWFTAVCSWKPEAAVGNDIGVSVNGGGAWTEEDDDPTTPVIQINALSVGNWWQFQGAGPDPIQIDKWALVSGYKAACPW